MLQIHIQKSTDFSLNKFAGCKQMSSFFIANVCQFYFAEKKNLNMSMQKIDNQAGLACSSESHLHLSLQRKPDKPNHYMKL